MNVLDTEAINEIIRQWIFRSWHEPDGMEAASETFADMAEWQRDDYRDLVKTSLQIGYQAGIKEAAKTCAEAQSEITKLREALDKIASWNEGDEVDGSFDEPGSAAIAREALGKGEG